MRLGTCGILLSRQGYVNAEEIRDYDRMSVENQKASAFITRLLSNPALKPWTPLQREEQILQFLQANASQLVPTLSSASFFSGMSWNQILSLLVVALMEAVDKDLSSDLAQIVNTTVDFGYVALIGQKPAPQEKIRAQILTFVNGLLTKQDARRGFTGAYAALAYGVIDKYLEAIWNRKSYIHFEVTKVQRLRVSRQEVKAIIETTLLLKPTICMITAGGSNPVSDQATGTIQPQFAEKVFVAAKKQLSLLPDQVIKSGINSSISFLDNKFIEATARLAAIFAARSRNLQPNVRVDRGADSPDKSWLSIARRNYKFYGFDVKMLDELYSIAAENGW